MRVSGVRFGGRLRVFKDEDSAALRLLDPCRGRCCNAPGVVFRFSSSESSRLSGRKGTLHRGSAQSDFDAIAQGLIGDLAIGARNARVSGTLDGVPFSAVQSGVAGTIEHGGVEVEMFENPSESIRYLEQIDAGADDFCMAPCTYRDGHESCLRARSGGSASASLDHEEGWAGADERTDAYQAEGGLSATVETKAGPNAYSDTTFVPCFRLDAELAGTGARGAVRDDEGRLLRTDSYDRGIGILRAKDFSEAVLTVNGFSRTYQPPVFPQTELDLRTEVWSILWDETGLLQVPVLSISLALSPVI